MVFFAYSSGFNSCSRITCVPCWLICCRPPADSIYTALWEAFDGLGLNWRFAEAAASKQSWAACLTRILAVCISIGGSLVTALLLGLTSGGDGTNAAAGMASEPTIACWDMSLLLVLISTGGSDHHRLHACQAVLECIQHLS